MLDFLPGKKTYVIGAMLIAWGVLSMFLSEIGSMPLALDPMEPILEGLALFGLRKAIK